MACLRRVGLRLAVTAVIAWAAVTNAARAAPDTRDDLRTQARRCEKEGDWAKACSFYAFLLSKDPSLKEVRERFQTCLRHFHRARRHHDASYSRQVLSQDVLTALKLYGEVLARLQAEFLDDDKAELDRLFHQGLEELRLALNDEAFRRQYLAGVKKETIRSFLDELNATWERRVVRHQLDAQNQALQVALAAKRTLGLRPTVTVLEIACGACNALDEYTYYLTPRQYGEDDLALRGEAGGVGFELAEADGKLLVTHVVPESPAAKAGLAGGDQITRVGGEPAAKLSAETAAEKLRGRVGSPVEVEVFSPLAGARRLTLPRQALPVRSVGPIRIYDEQAGIGYVRLVTFHENTPQELDDAIRQLELQGLRSLIIDLRGNVGGAFEPSVLVAERFLEEGAAIVSTRGRARDARRTSRNASPLVFPLVVLIDGSTASAAEVLAGALKDNGRATLIGQPAFGKNTVQHAVELSTVQAGGIRITWARFCSPLRPALAEGGVTPHVLVEQTPKSMFDDQLHAALTWLATHAP